MSAIERVLLPSFLLFEEKDIKIFHGFYSTMGQYDCAIITEFPSDEVVMAGLLALGSQGTLRTTTLKAFPANEFAEIVKKLP